MFAKFVQLFPEWLDVDFLLTELHTSESRRKLKSTVLPETRLAAHSSQHFFFLFTLSCSPLLLTLRKRDTASDVLGMKSTVWVSHTW